MKITLKLLYITVSILFFLLACNKKVDSNNTIPENVQILMDQTIKIHDEVMPETATIHRLKKRILAKLDSTTTHTDILERAVLDLENADESMMDWMHKYKQFDRLDKDVDPLNYYQMEKMHITKVKKQMLTAINNAKILLENE